MRVHIPVFVLLSAAVLPAQVTVTLGTSSNCGTLQGGQTCTLTARVLGATNATVTWNFSPTVSGATIGTGSAPDSTGLSTNTYKAPNFISTRQVVTVTATSAADPTQSASAQITLTPVTITVAVSPLSATLGPNQSQQFTATVLGTSQTGVTWSINPQLGAIDSNTGLYTAPASITTSQKVTVTATSTFDSTVSGSATVNLQPPPTVSVTISPTAVSLTNSQSQQFTATVQNSTAGVTWSLSPQTGTIDANGLYTAPALINASSKVTVTVTSNSDTTKSASATITLNPLIDVGTGAPTSAIQQAFLSAYYRNGFNGLVALPPIANVKKLGTTGYVQEFQDAAKDAGLKLALVTASPSAPASSDGSVLTVVQMLANLYAYFTTVGVTTAGYPLMDTQTCPGTDPSTSCTWDLFDKGYALFAYDNPQANGQNFTIRQAFYTEWTAMGGISGPGPALDVETNLTASTGTTLTMQAYRFGAAYSITSGINKGKTFGVKEPVYDLYVGQSGPAGILGAPTSELTQVATGVYRQTFEGGALQYTGSGDPTLQLPVQVVSLTGAPLNNTATLQLGQTITITATPYASTGQALTDRPITWSTSNARVISIQATGGTAVLTAVGGGSASVTASSGGVTSARVSFIVIAPCCQVGDGAPASVQQSFQDALTRNHLTPATPVQAPATRVGAGYVQMLQTSDGTPFMLAQSDQLGAAYVVSGPVLDRYLSLGGPAGSLGYPAGDRSPGGTQRFANNAALAGAPVRVVSGGVLAKWALLSYETGAAGPPTADAAPFSTFMASSGVAQDFSGGSIYSATAGQRSGQNWFVTGLILARYQALNGPAGDYGMPTSDEFVSGALHQQNFEGGNLAYLTGDTAAVEHPAPKVPGVIVAPSTISAGGRARLAVVGFSNNSTVRVSLSGQPDFTVTSANGAYAWDMAVPLTARSGTVAIHAADTKSTAAADAVLTIRGFVDNRIPLAKLDGDNQTGMPGAILPLALRVALRDASGAPVAGATVTFQSSPGAQVSSSSAVTDSFGMAQAFLRLPSAEGVTAVTVDAPSIAQTPVSFYARAAAATLANYPKLLQAGDAPLGNGTATVGQKGALVTAVASMLRYHQNRGELPAPNGLADAGLLNQYLRSYCSVDANGGRLCDGYLSNPDSGEQIANLWRAADFTGGVNVVVQNATTAAIADIVAQGSPALLTLALSRNGALAGGHFVVAIGAAADGSIVIHDPNPFFARTRLNDYSNGFTAGGASWTGELKSVVQFSRAIPAATRFLVAALSQSPDLMKSLALDVQSPEGECGRALELLDTLDAAGSGSALASRIQVCDGSGPVYQLTAGIAQPFRAFVTDLAPGGPSQDISASTPSTYKVTRPKLALTLTPQDASFSADGVVNGADFTAGIAPGGLISIFGSGLAGTSTPTTVMVDDAPAEVIGAWPFQVNAVLPATLAAGSHDLQVQSAFGTAHQAVNVQAVAPAIFLALNQNYSLNDPSTPLARGQSFIIYATGLGAVTRSGQLFTTTTPVTAVLNGLEIPTQFAGLSGFPGVYQVNIAIPATTPPGLSLSLALKSGGQVSRTISVAVQ